MPKKAELQGQLLEKAKVGRDIAAKAEAENRDLNADERVLVTKSLEDALEIKNHIAAMDADSDMVKQLNALGLEHGVLAQTATEKAAVGEMLSVGQKFTESEAIKSWFKQASPNGHVISKDSRVHSPAVQFGGAKDILATGGGTTGAGNLVNSDRLGLIDQGMFQRPLTLVDLVAKGTTGSDLVEFVREGSFTNNAAPVAEAQGVQPYVSGAGQVSGLKPQSAFTLTPDSTSVKTIAHWIPVTKRALSDAAQVRTLIDNFLRYGLEEELEDQVANGDGTGENFTGILNTSGTTAQAWDTNLLTTTRKAKTKVRTVGRARATAYVFNPADNERFDLLTNGNGDFIFGAPTGNQVQTLWGLPRVECEGIPEGTGLVADWTKAILFDREQASIQLSDSHLDFFTRNLVAILSELRAAFVVIRPAAFVEIDLTA